MKLGVKVFFCFNPDPCNNDKLLVENEQEEETATSNDCSLNVVDNDSASCLLSANEDLADANSPEFLSKGINLLCNVYEFYSITNLIDSSSKVSERHDVDAALEADPMLFESNENDTRELFEFYKLLTLYLFFCRK